MPDTWEYSDELALLAKRVKALEEQQAALIADLAHVKAAQERTAEYQGVKHLLSPQ